MENNFANKTCPFCKAELTAQDTIAVCDTCGAYQHITCWQKNMGCTTEGCQGRIKDIIEPDYSSDDPTVSIAGAVVPQPAQESEAPAEETVEAPDVEPTETPAEETAEAPDVEPTETPAEETVEAPADVPVEAEAIATEPATFTEDEIPAPVAEPAPFTEGEIPAPVAEPVPFAEGEITAPFVEGQIAPKPKKSKKLFIIIGAAAAVVIAAVVCLVIFLFIPMNKYNTACTALENKDFDAAYQQFVELGGYSDSKEKAKETLYKKGEHLLENKEYDDAIDTFTQLGEYKNASEMVLESKYQKAYNYRDESNYEYAYKYFEKILDYKDSKTQLDAALIMWEAEVLADGSTSQSYRFKETVNLTSDQYMLYYGTLELYISGHDTAEDWTDDNYKVMLDLFGLLPASYEDTATYTKLFTTLYDYGEAYLFTDKASLAKQCWSLDFVQSLAQQDHSVWAFLVGNWSTYSGNYYLKFEDRGDEGYYCHYNVPFTDHANTEYIDIIDMTFVHKDKDSKILGNVYDISIIDFNTIRIYSYSNNQTYTLYR
ncbi:MAG: hypothetical protein E7532_01360 [Ruminococcaceae bacterium]|nr:hypothetical protein [Oscillospiraceae bacterium]